MYMIGHLICDNKVASFNIYVEMCSLVLFKFEFNLVEKNLILCGLFSLAS
jgi:hypothetical protein